MPQTLLDDRYTHGELLGSGGMAEVYLAHDEVLDRDVALKVLKDKYAKNEEFVKRFRREARSAASLNHPSIVSIYDWGCSEDGAYFIAMEHVPGGTLKDRILRQGALDPGPVVEVALQIADALSVAHEHGMIHRDIKSPNILLTEAGYAKVADFGIARAATATTTSSRSSLVLGTPGYISPEQAKGEPVGPWSDLYSLGIVLYEMLTGGLPYSAKDPVALATRHVEELPRSPREANPEVPEALDALTLRLLAKDPEDRYASAVELVGDLERVRIGPSPLSVATEKTTAEMTAAPLLSPGKKRPKRIAIQPPATSPMDVFKSGRRVRGRLLRTLAMALCGVLLLGGLAWALTQYQSTPGTSGSEEVSSTEEAVAPATVPEVPESYDASEAEGALADDADLETGDRNEASDDVVTAGYGIEQDPEEGTAVEEDTAVDVAVSTGPEQVPAATQAAPTLVGTVGSGQEAPAVQPAAPKAADLKQVPAAIQEAPSSVGAGSRQEAPTAQAASANIKTASGPSVSDKTEQKGKKAERKGKK